MDVSQLSNEELLKRRGVSNLSNQELLNLAAKSRPMKALPPKALPPSASYGEAALAGVIGGGASTLQMLENAGKLQERFSPTRILSKQPISREPGFFGRQAQQARDYISSKGAFSKDGPPAFGLLPANIPKREGFGTKLVEGLSEAPAYVAQAGLLGGGIPGLVAQGVLQADPNNPRQMLEQGGLNAVLGSVLKGVSRIQPKATSISRVTPYLSGVTRSGLSGTVMGIPAALQGQDGAEVAAKFAQGAMLGARKAGYAPPKAQQAQVKLASEVIKPSLPPEGAMVSREAGKRGMPAGATPETVGMLKAFIANTPKVKNYTDAVNAMNAKREQFQNVVDNLALNKNVPVPDHTAILRQRIAAARIPGSQVTDAKLAQMEDVLARELQISRLNSRSAVLRKRELQDEISPQLGKMGKGTLNVELQPGRKQALLDLWEGLKESIESIDPRIRPINESIKGLIDVANQLGKHEQEILNTAVPGIFQRAFSTVRGSVPGTAANVVRSAASTSGKGLGARTKKIIQLRKYAK